MSKPKKLSFDSELQWYSPVAEFPGKVTDYILYQKDTDIVELRTSYPNVNIKVNGDGTISPVDPSKPTRFTTAPYRATQERKDMSKDELKSEVDRIIALSGDDEAAHSEEDDLYVRLLMLYLPADLISEVVRLQKADFARWCA